MSSPSAPLTLPANCCALPFSSRPAPSSRRAGSSLCCLTLPTASLTLPLILSVSSPMSKLLDILAAPGAGARHSRIKNHRAFNGFLALAHVAEQPALDESFAGIIAWNSLPPALEHDAMAERLMAWLQPGGRLLLSGDGDTGGYAAALTRRGMVEMAHVEHDASCDGAMVSLLRKPCSVFLPSPRTCSGVH